MAGYNGFSMSNNAVDAYTEGERPYSKWTKGDIIQVIKDETDFDVSKLKKIPINTLRSVFLYKSSWHHTGLYYNKTEFYSVDSSKVESLTDAEINRLADVRKNLSETQKQAEKVTCCRCVFLEWAGTRKHPKATEVVEIGYIKGDWFYRKDGSKKSVTAKGFRLLEVINEKDVKQKIAVQER